MRYQIWKWGVIFTDNVRPGKRNDYLNIEMFLSSRFSMYSSTFYSLLLVILHFLFLQYIYLMWR